MSGLYFSGKTTGAAIVEVLKFLNGNYDVILKELEGKMNTASENLEFERAIEYKGTDKQCEKDCSETKDHRFERRRQRYSGGRLRKGKMRLFKVFFIRGGTADRKDHFYLRISSGEKKHPVF